MDKMAIFRTNIRNNRNGQISSYYTFVRCSYPLYLTTLNINDSPLSTIHSKNDNTNTYFKYSTATERKGATNIRLGPFNNDNTTNLQGAIPSFNQSLENPNNPLEIVYSNVDIYLNDEPIYQDYTNPSLGNSQSELENLSFSNFIVNANSYTQDIENNDGTLFMLFYNRSLSNSQTTDGLYPIKEKAFTKGSIYTDYNNSTSDNMIFKFPIFMSGVYFNVGSTYEIRLAKQVYNSEYNTMTYEYFGDPIQFTVSNDVTQDYINQLNQQTATSTDSETTQELQNSINDQTNAINNQTESIDNINTSINNSNVDNSSIDLPTDNTQNPTQSGIDNIFQTIYNGFTSGTPQDIVFPLPYSTNNITIKPNYINQMLNSSERR